MKLAIVLTLLSSWAFAAKTYQVTGPVLEVSDSKITVQKGSEKWELDRDPVTKGTDVKVGDKVTMTYTMTAKTIEIKGGGKADKKTDQGKK